MFATQLNGLFKKIQENQIESIEDGARLLSQASVAEGTIYVYGTNEMAAISHEATTGSEPLNHCTTLHPDESLERLENMDRVLLITRYSSDPQALQLAKKLTERQIHFVAISTHIEESHDTLVELADVHIDLQLIKGLLPNDAGERFGYPSSMAALYVYYGLKFTIDEILAEY
jgi:Domain of unknown function (DUF2529)